MKYIRTENGIYKVSKKITYCGKNFYYTTAEVTLEDVDIIAQADNIEELCDVFVTKGNRHIVWDKQQNKGITFEQVKESFPSYHFKIYGAIWTSKGLIYVAKMNSEGELELI